MSVTQYFHIYEKSYSPILIQPGCGVLSWLLTVILFGYGLQIFWKKIMTHLSVWFLPKNTAPFLRKSWLLTQSYVIFPLHNVFSSDFLPMPFEYFFLSVDHFSPLSSFWGKRSTVYEFVMAQRFFVASGRRRELSKIRVKSIIFRSEILNHRKSPITTESLLVPYNFVTLLGEEVSNI